MKSPLKSLFYPACIHPCRARCRGVCYMFESSPLPHSCIDFIPVVAAATVRKAREMGRKGKWFDTVQRILSTSEPDPAETDANKVIICNTSPREITG